MKKSISMRQGILVLVLLGVCYAANWTDDYYSFAVANQWHAFSYANGTPTALSGGGTLENSFALLAVSDLKAASDTQKKAAPDSSSISAAFGDPNSDGSSITKDDDGNSSAGGSRSTTRGMSFRGTQNQLGGIQGLSARTPGGAFGSSYGSSLSQFDRP
jgi:hypothetical protein